jgi:hypothetical protein
MWLSRYNDGLRAGRPGFDSWKGQDFYLLDSVHTGSGALPASYLIDKEGDFPEGKAAGSWSWPLISI